LAKVYHHDDHDGRAAGFLVKKFYAEQGKEIECIEVDYNSQPPINTIQPDEDIWIVDYSFEPELMWQVLEMTHNIHFIDHHQTAMEKYNDFPEKLAGLRVNGLAGCELTWIYITLLDEGIKCFGALPTFFEENKEKFLQDMPLFVNLIGDKDVWRWEHGEKTECFDLGLRSYDTSVNANVWEKLYYDFFELDGGYHTILIDAGKTIKKYRDQWSKDYREANGFPVEFEGLNCYAMNIGRVGSEFFGEKSKEYDIVIPFVFHKDGSWKISLYSVNPNVDCAKLAQKYGGGGHKGASGLSYKGDINKFFKVLDSPE